ncbi:MAG: TlyA family RNA methyltransferase [Eubacteriales bacterium]|nr:TlyA family RNA methyltransferase [Eubacteriales bacterium]
MKKRLDVLLTERGLAPSREKARALIMAGLVYVRNQKEDKPGAFFPEETEVEVRGQGLRYVSRGGLKLEKAMTSFSLDLRGRICMDIGASTGGFTDCMLQNGAAAVYAIDVGYGQLDYRLRTDPRVICMEKTNFRYVTPESLDPERMPDFASVDVSFISLSRILPPAHRILPPGGEMVCLIKPQFEAGREKVGKKGVVRDPQVHAEVIEQTILTARKTGFEILGLDWSPIRGPEGNIEYLVHLRRLPEEADSAAPEEGASLRTGTGSGAGQFSVSRQEIEELVRRSHADLG